MLALAPLTARFLFLYLYQWKLERCRSFGGLEVLLLFLFLGWRALQLLLFCILNELRQLLSVLDEVVLVQTDVLLELLTDLFL